MVYGWLTAPGVSRWWGSRGAAEAAIRIAFDASSALTRIIEHDGFRIGYAHAAEGGASGEAHARDLAPATFEVALFIAEARFRGRGFGLEALRQLRDETFASRIALALCALVPVAEERAVRLYEKAGFSWVRVHFDPLMGPAWLMLCERPKVSKQPKIWSGR